MAQKQQIGALLAGSQWGEPSRGCYKCCGSKELRPGGFRQVIAQNRSDVGCPRSQICEAHLQCIVTFESAVIVNGPTSSGLHSQSLCLDLHIELVLQSTCRGQGSTAETIYRILDAWSCNYLHKTLMGAGARSPFAACSRLASVLPGWSGKIGALSLSRAACSA